MKSEVIGNDKSPEQVLEYWVDKWDTTWAELMQVRSELANTQAELARFEQDPTTRPTVASWNAIVAERDDLRAARHIPELDNHHNAAGCPYCSPTLQKQDAENRSLVEALDRVKALHRSRSHQPEPLDPSSAYDICDDCHKMWPCPTSRAVAALRREET